MGTCSSRIWLTALIGLISASCWANGNDPVPLRGKNVKCGIYLVNRHETSKGVMVSEGINVHAFREALQAKIDEVGLEEAFPQTHRIEVVGAPRRGSEREALVEEIRKSFLKMGIEYDAEIVAVREALDWLGEARGVYVESRTGKWRRIADGTPASIQEAIKRGILPENADYLVVGTPVVGLRDTLESAGLEPHHINTQSTFRASVQKAMAHPLQFLGHLGSLARSMFPYKEDYQAPTAEETRSALRKTVTPGLVNAGALFYQGKPLLSILLPTVFVNGLNSFFKGKYESAFQRWLTRSGAMGRFTKQMLITTIFATDIYFLGNLSNASQALSWAGVYGFFTAKWASILFQTLWRLPVESLLGNWANWQVAQATDAKAAETARNTRSNMSKLNSYLMTPAFIHSLLMKPHEAWFLLTNGPGGIDFTAGTVPEGHSLYFAFGAGHAGMLVAGAVGGLGLLRLSAINPWGKLANWVDRGESAVINCFSGVCRSGWNFVSGNR